MLSSGGPSAICSLFLCDVGVGFYLYLMIVVTKYKKHTINVQGKRRVGTIHC